MKLIPLGQHVIVRPDPVDEMQRGLIIPDQYLANFQTKTGTVIMLGDYVRERLTDGTVETRPFKVKEGDHILYGQYSGLDFNFDFKEGKGEETLKHMREDEIIGIIKDENVNAT